MSQKASVHATDERGWPEEAVVEEETNFGWGSRQGYYSRVSGIRGYGKTYHFIIAIGGMDIHSPAIRVPSESQGLIAKPIPAAGLQPIHFAALEREVSPVAFLVQAGEEQHPMSGFTLPDDPCMEYLPT